MVNGGYVYDAEHHRAAAAVDRAVARRAARPERPGHPLRRAGRRGRAGAAAVPGRRPARAWTGSAARWCCASFDPAGLPALYLVDRVGRVPRRAARRPGSGSTSCGPACSTRSPRTDAAGPARSWCSTTATRWSAGSPRSATRTWCGSPSRRCTARRCCSATTRCGRPTRRCSTARSWACSTGRSRGRTMNDRRRAVGPAAARPDHMPYGAAQIALVEQVVRHADAGGYDELRFAARHAGHHGVRATAASRPSRSSRSPGAAREYDARPGPLRPRTHEQPAAVAVQVHGRRRC